jgi:hypothetical protein
MRKVDFECYGHPNIVADHKTTLEITTEDFLTKQGTCIIGVRGNLALSDLDSEIKTLAGSSGTRIILTLKLDNLVERISGWGSPRLQYSDNVSMVARTSSFECGRTLMVRSDKAAMDLNRDFVDRLRDDRVRMRCSLEFLREP